MKKVFDFPAEELGENTMGARGRSGATAASSPTSNGNYNIAGVTGTSNS